ncbi:MAG: MgtC/SapB family protein [Betaproteobacteria bacterium]|nr:MAG: MgtC/SapB family protein [Betaproteobacteria bacterium]
MTPEYLAIVERLMLATAAGALIGLERSYHGRPAGFRTHTLVSIASALLMLVTAYESLWFETTTQARITLDPTRMAQGIMTGIGFLGAGVIMKEGLSVRGLTTAASIWITAAIGVLVGVGFYFPAAISVALTLGVLSFFRWIESKLPRLSYAQLVIRFPPESLIEEKDLRRLVQKHGFSVANLNYRFERFDGFAEYRMTIRSPDTNGTNRLFDALRATPCVSQFRIVPTGD